MHDNTKEIRILTNATHLLQKKDLLYLICQVQLHMTYSSLVFQRNQKAPDSHHTLQDCSTKGLWLHLHQTVQMFDDREGRRQMQLRNQRNFFKTSSKSQTGTIYNTGLDSPSNFFRLRTSKDDSNVDKGDICIYLLQSVCSLVN